MSYNTIIQVGLEHATDTAIHHHFDEAHTLHELKHYLPAQAPLKDFIHHNTLHAFQHLPFYEAIIDASVKFGFKGSISLHEYKELYQSGKISEDMMKRAIESRGLDVHEWMDITFRKDSFHQAEARIGALRSLWKSEYRTDLDSLVHPTLFRVLCSYLDQGISISRFPVTGKGFLDSVTELERNSFTSFFRTSAVKKILLSGNYTLTGLLQQLTGDESLYEQYIFDQQFAHQGWSGMVSVVEDNPETLLDTRAITLRELIIFECLLELDALNFRLNNKWKPLSAIMKQRPVALFAPVEITERDIVVGILQDAYEWTYYDKVLGSIRANSKRHQQENHNIPSFQGLFCIDDRECSIRRHLEQTDPSCVTYGTPGFFSVEFYFQPEHGKFHTKQCPAPVSPAFIVRENETRNKNRKDVHFTRHTNSLSTGWFASQALGILSAFRLAINIFRPALTTAMAYSFNHMDEYSTLDIENKGHEHNHEGKLNPGYTVTEMANRVEGLLKSIGLVKNFSPVIYVVGHGSSSINNPHYAAYDCGACSGRPGSVNARVFAFMGNHEGVREILRHRGIVIPANTQFVGALHDTSRDDIMFYDENVLSATNAGAHKRNTEVFNEALDHNARERARRLDPEASLLSPEKAHDRIRLRSVSLFEPRPELNHSNNAFTIIGRRELSHGLFMDRRAFLNSYDYRLDPKGELLSNILIAAAPVCGGINLEYYFSRVDNQKLGASTKLPHNVMGLIGVANGIEGDLRTGLPSQMIDLHEPVRMFFVVEQYPDTVMQVIRSNKDTWNWFINEWIHLAVINPATQELLYFHKGQFKPYLADNRDTPVYPPEMAEEPLKEQPSVYLIS